MGPLAPDSCIEQMLRRADAVAVFERRANNLLAQVNAYRDLSSSLALDTD
jgi:hypothetical protein